MTGQVKALSVLGNFLVLATAPAKEAATGYVARVPVRMNVVGANSEDDTFGVISGLVQLPELLAAQIAGKGVRVGGWFGMRMAVPIAVNSTVRALQL